MEISKEIMSLEIINNDDDQVILKVVIKNTNLIKMCSSDDFKYKIENLIAERIINILPIEKFNEITNKIDLDSVAKLTTIKLSEKISGRY